MDRLVLGQFSRLTQRRWAPLADPDRADIADVQQNEYRSFDPADATIPHHDRCHRGDRDTQQCVQPYPATKRQRGDHRTDAERNQANRDIGTDHVAQRDAGRMSERRRHRRREFFGLRAGQEDRQRERRHAETNRRNRQMLGESLRAPNNRGGTGNDGDDPQGDHLRRALRCAVREHRGPHHRHAPEPKSTPIYVGPSSKIEHA